MDKSRWSAPPVSGKMSVAASAATGSARTREPVWQEWLARTAQGDHDAFSALYDAAGSLVFSLALRVLGDRADAEEVTLDVFVQVWKDAGRFDERRGNVGSWLVMMARSRALDRFRSRGARRKHESPEENFDTFVGGQSPETLATLSSDRRHVAAALQALTPEQRQAIELAFFQGLSHSELAARLGLPLGTVKTRVRLGLIKLREHLSGVAN